MTVAQRAAAAAALRRAMTRAARAWKRCERYQRLYLAAYRAAVVADVGVARARARLMGLR